MQPAGVQATTGGPGALGEQSHVHRVQPVGILVGTDGVQDGVGVDLRRQWQLHEDAVDAVVFVHLLHHADNVGGAAVAGRAAAGRRAAPAPPPPFPCCARRSPMPGRRRRGPHRARAGPAAVSSRARWPTSPRTAAATALPSMITALIRSAAPIALDDHREPVEDARQRRLLGDTHDHGFDPLVGEQRGGDLLGDRLEQVVLARSRRHGAPPRSSARSRRRR